MKRPITTLLYLALSASTCLGQITSCPGYNYNATTVFYGTDGTIGHVNGEHAGAAELTGQCTYASIGQANCSTTCAANASAGATDNGALTNGFKVHAVAYASSPGFASSNGGAATCASTAAYTATGCLISCSIAISFNATATGVGTTVNFPSTNLSFNTSIPDQTNCIAEPDPTHLNSITVTPADAVIFNVTGGDGAITTQQFTATGVYSGGGTKPLSAIWTSSNTSIATVNSTGLAKATGTAWGTLTITASSGSVSGFATLTVSYNTDQGGGGGGDECGGDYDCSENLCCYNGSCLVCQNQGLHTKKPNQPLIKDRLK